MLPHLDQSLHQMEEEWSEGHNHNVQNSLQMATQKTDKTQSRTSTR